MAALVAADTDKDHEAQVAKYSRLYTTEQWLQPRSLVQVQLAKLKEETRCPMCFGRIRSARISMVCLHRYCAKCIEQYLRAKVPGRHGDDKECPVCRAHLHSRRATKPDPVFDKIIKALYGDVDQYDAEEEELIAADNKRHVAEWQAQLADLKARQAAAVAAAKSGSGALLPAVPERRSAAASEAAEATEGKQPPGASGAFARPGSLQALASAGSAPSRPPLPSGMATNGLAAAAAAGTGTGPGLSSKKRSWADLPDGRTGTASSGLGKVARAAGAGDVSGADGGSRGRGSSGANGLGGEGPRGARSGSNSWQRVLSAGKHDAGGGGGGDDDVDAALLLASLQDQQPGQRQNWQQPDKRAASGSGKSEQRRSAAAAGQGGGSELLARSASGSKKKKKKASAQGAAARLLGMAARAAATAGPLPGRCLVHLQPLGQLKAEQPSGATGFSTGRGRGRAQGNHQQQQQQQHSADITSSTHECGDVSGVSPLVDQPYLACPLELTVASLKQLLLQQLRQQISASPGLAAAAAGWQQPLQSESIQLLMPPGTDEKAGVDEAAAAGGGDASGAGKGVLCDTLTVGDLCEMWPGYGPEVQVQYRLLLQRQQQQSAAPAAGEVGSNLTVVPLMLA